MVNSNRHFSPTLPCPPDAVDEFLSRPTPGSLSALADTPGPFLVLGAGGKMGLHLSAMLRRSLDALGRRDQVVAASRFSSLRHRDDFEKLGVSTMVCDLTDPGEVAGLPEAATVFFMAGVKFGTASSPDLLNRINVEMPRLVARRFPSARIVVFSTGCVYPFVPVDGGGADESVPPFAIGEYASSCIAREHAFGILAAAQATPVVLIRLNYSVELRYGILVDIAQRVLAGEPLDISTGHVNLIWQRDAVAHAIQSLTIAGCPATPINITGPDTLSVRGLALRFGEAFEREPVFTGTEADTAWLSDARRSHRLFGPPATRLDDMITWVATWLRTVGATWQKPTGFERRDGKF